MEFDERLTRVGDPGGGGGKRRRWWPTLLLPLLLLVGGGLWFGLYAVSPGPADRETLVYIPPGSPFTLIERQLIEVGVLRPDRRFRWLAGLSGQRRQLKAGEYAVAAGATPWDILALLAAGRPVRRQVTIPEGANLYQVAELLAEQQLVEQRAFIDFATDPATVEGLGLNRPVAPESPGHSLPPSSLSPPPSSLEGWLFPDTYFFTRGQRQDEIAGVMVARTRRVLAELLAELDNESGLNELELLTLASIVEKETGLAAERTLIAGVFYNRLKLRMRLQTDPTVIYGLQSFGRPLTRQDLRTPTPYNTYLISGLPPGPIANPGREALIAVLRPQASDYLYFVSRNDGSHQFSRNLREHNRAVRRYQRQ